MKRLSKRNRKVCRFKFAGISADLRLSVLAIAVVIFGGGCSVERTVDLPPIPVAPDKTVVTVNGEAISMEEFDAEFRLMRIHYDAVTENEMRAIKRRLSEQVIDRRLLVQEARSLGLKLTRSEAESALKEALRGVPEDFWAELKAQGISKNTWKRKLLQERLARDVVDREVNAEVVITPEETEDYYWTHLPFYWRPAAVEARHLVVQKRGDLDKVLSGLKKGVEFPKLASTFSVGPGKSRGGDWGFMGTDRLSADYLKVLSALQPGEVSKPLKDEIGYHLFQLVGWRQREMKPFTEVRDQIHEDLLKEEQDHRFDQWMADLKKKAVIKVNQEMAAAIGIDLEDKRD